MSYSDCDVAKRGSFESYRRGTVPQEGHPADVLRYMGNMNVEY